MNKCFVFIALLFFVSCKNKTSQQDIDEIKLTSLKDSSKLKLVELVYEDFYENDSLVLAWKQQIIDTLKFSKKITTNNEYDSFLLPIKEIKLKDIGSINIGLEDYYVEKSLAFGFQSDSLVVGSIKTNESFSLKFKNSKLEKIFFNSPNPSNSNAQN